MDSFDYSESQNILKMTVYLKIQYNSKNASVLLIWTQLSEKRYSCIKWVFKKNHVIGYCFLLVFEYMSMEHMPFGLKKARRVPQFTCDCQNWSWLAEK